MLDAQDMLVLRGAKKERVEEYARCELFALINFHLQFFEWHTPTVEGISFDEAVERKKGFRYLL